MILTLESYNNSWQDISSKVSQVDDIPLLSLNEYREVTAEPFKFKIVNTVDAALINNKNNIRFAIDSNSRYLGYISKTEYLYKERCWQCENINQLFKLDDYKVDYSTLHNQLASTADRGQYGSDSSGFESTNILWLIECMMTIAGFTYNISALYPKVSSNFVLTKFAYDHYLVDMRIDEGMLYCINQNYATTHDRLDNNSIEGYNAFERKVSFYYLFQKLTGLFNITVEYVNGVFVFRRSYPLNFEEYAIDNNYVSNYSETTEDFRKINNASYITEAYWNRPNYNNYTGDYSLIHKIAYDGNADTTIRFPNNLLFPVRYGGGGDNLWDVWVSLYDYHISCDEFAFNYVRKSPLYSQNLKKKWIANIQTDPKSVLSHYINVRERSSIITQGYY
ncbi:MAG: hypothetical protein AB1633_00190 [Elusimicrobiota bacterium]